MKSLLLTLTILLTLFNQIHSLSSTSDQEENENNNNNTITYIGRCIISGTEDQANIRGLRNIEVTLVSLENETFTYTTRSIDEGLFIFEIDPEGGVSYEQRLSSRQFHDRTDFVNIELDNGNLWGLDERTNLLGLWIVLAVLGTLFISLFIICIVISSFFLIPKMIRLSNEKSVGNDNQIVEQEEGVEGEV